MTPRSAALLRERAELQRQLARVDAALAASLPRGRGMNPAGVAVSDQEPPVIGALIAPVTRRTKPRARQAAVARLAGVTPGGSRAN